MTTFPPAFDAALLTSAAPSGCGADAEPVDQAVSDLAARLSVAREVEGPARLAGPDNNACNHV